MPLKFLISGKSLYDSVSDVMLAVEFYGVTDKGVIYFCPLLYFKGLPSIKFIS